MLDGFGESADPILELGRGFDTKDVLSGGADDLEGEAVNGGLLEHAGEVEGDGRVALLAVGARVEVQLGGAKDAVELLVAACGPLVEQALLLARVESGLVAADDDGAAS